MAVYRSFSAPGGFMPPVDKGLQNGLLLINANAEKIARFAAKELKKITPVKTGFMRSQVKYWSLRIYSAGGFAFRLGWRKRDFAQKRAFYPPYVILGTGIYAGRGMITPVRAKRLAWQYKSRWVSAQAIRGQRPQALFKKVMPAVQRYVRTIINASVRTGFEGAFR